MTDPSDTLVVIPARMASTRLPGKPLADIHGEPMIVHVWKRAIEAVCGDVLVAVAEAEIAQAVEGAGGLAVMTDADLPSGSDRVHQAVERHDPYGKYKTIVNLQGDLPTIDPAYIRLCADILHLSGADISTLAAEIRDDDETASPNVVKALADLATADHALARDFVRVLPPDEQPPFWHHIGIYGYRRQALERFVKLDVSPREKDRKLEQMRALDNHMTIAVGRVDTVPFGVDAPADLDRARTTLKKARFTD